MTAYGHKLKQGKVAVSHRNYWGVLRRDSPPTLLYRPRRPRLANYKESSIRNAQQLDRQTLTQMSDSSSSIQTQTVLRWRNFHSKKLSDVSATRTFLSARSVPGHRIIPLLEDRSIDTACIGGDSRVYSILILIVGLGQLN